MVNQLEVDSSTHYRKAVEANWQFSLKNGAELFTLWNLFSVCKNRSSARSRWRTNACVTRQGYQGQHVHGFVNRKSHVPRSSRAHTWAWIERRPLARKNDPSARIKLWILHYPSQMGSRGRRATVQGSVSMESVGTVNMERRFKSTYLRMSVLFVPPSPTGRLSAGDPDQPGEHRKDQLGWRKWVATVITHTSVRVRKMILG